MVRQQKHNNGNSQTMDKKKRPFKAFRKKATIPESAPKSATKLSEGINEELPILHPGHEGSLSNIHICQEKWQTYVTLHFGDIGIFFSTLEYPVYKEPEFDGDSILDDTTGILKGIYIDDFKTYQKKLDKLEEKKVSVFAFIFGQMSEESKQVCARSKKYEKVITRQNHPLKLWKIIRRTHLSAQTGHNRMDRRQARKEYEVLRQHPDGETLLEFKKRYKHAIETLHAVGETVPSEEDQAIDFLEKLDQNKYAEFAADLHNDAANKQEMRVADTFPNTLAAMYACASRYKIVVNKSRVPAGTTGVAAVFTTTIEENAAASKKDKSSENISEAEQQRRKAQKEKARAAYIIAKRGNEGGKGGRGRGGGRNGGGAGRGGHGGRGGGRGGGSRNDEGGSERHPPEGVCFMCGESGHKCYNCPRAEEVREYLKTCDSRDDNSGSNKKGKHTALVTTDYKLKSLFIAHTAIEICDHKKHNSLVLDPGASDHLFANSNLLTNLRKTDDPIWYNGVGGGITVTRCGDFGSLGRVNYSPDSPANILSFSTIRKTNLELEYNYVMDTFIVYGPHSTLYFPCKPDGLYVCDLNEDIVQIDNKSYMMETVTKNKMKYTRREVEAAERVAELKRNAGYPSDADLAMALQRGDFAHTDLTPRDVKIMRDIYGPNLGDLKGKTKRGRPTTTDVEYVDTATREQQSLEEDIMFVESIPFFISLSTPLGLIITTMLRTRTQRDVWEAQFQQLSIYKSEGFKVHKIFFDREGAIGALTEKIADAGYRPQQSGAGSHVPRIENKIKVVKERMRAVINTLPYLLPHQLIEWLVYYVVMRLNSMPSHTRMDTTPPRQLLLGRKIDVLTDLALSFGQYVQVHSIETITNTMKSRTDGALALMPTGNASGSWWFWTLRTLKPITRNNWTVMPLSEEVIALINKMSGSKKVNKDPVIQLGKSKKVIVIASDERNAAPANDDVELPGMLPGVRVAPEHHIDPTFGLERHPIPRDDDIILARADDVIPEMQEIIVNEGEEGEESGEVTQVPIEKAVVDIISGASGQYQLTSIDLDQLPSTTHLNYDDVYASTGDEPDTENPMIHPSLSSTVELPSIDRGPNKRRRKTTIAPTSMPAATRSSNRSNAGKSSRYAEYTYIVSSKQTQKNDWYNRKLQSAKARCQHVYRITVQAALQKYESVADEAIMKELVQLHDKKVFVGKHFRSLSPEERRKIIRSSMFLKEKYDAMGIFEKLKARLVAGGDMQDKSLYEDVSSPTASVQAVFIVAALAAKERRHVVTGDIGGAYLNADMVEVVHMLIKKDIAAILIKWLPEYKQYINEDGTLIVQLKKALYGCVESGRLWNKEITRQLVSMGYEQNPYEECVFNRLSDKGVQCTVVLYVDDLMMTSEDIKMIDNDMATLKNKYKEITVHVGDVHSYLGMTFDFSTRGKVKITMDGYVDDMLCRYNVRGSTTSPATEQLFQIDEDSDRLDEQQLSDFHSKVATLLYLTKRVRPDCLCATIFLTSRVLCATVEDGRKLDRLLKYINGTREMGITLECGETLQVQAFVDASFAVHAMKGSHTGYFITLGRGPIFAKSSKQKLVSKSSTEAELIGWSDSTPMVIWVEHFLEGQGYAPQPVKIFQDNQSTISMVKKGKSTSERTRHIDIRFFFMHDLIMRKKMIVDYLSTDQMIADILTKPLQGELFRRFRELLLNWETA